MARERHVTVNGRETVCSRAAPVEPLVLLHAFPLSADMWEAQLERAPDGWRFIAPDLRGFGPETPPSTRRRRMDDYAGDVLALMDALAIETAVIGGLSMGGYITFAMFRQAPERFTGIVLADTKAPPDTEEGRAGRRAMSETVKSSGVSAIVDTLLPRLLGETTRRERPEVVARAQAVDVWQFCRGDRRGAPRAHDAARFDARPCADRLPGTRDRGTGRHAHATRGR